MSRVTEIHSFNPLAHRVFFFPRRPAFCFAQGISLHSFFNSSWFIISSVNWGFFFRNLVCFHGVKPSLFESVRGRFKTFDECLQLNYISLLILFLWLLSLSFGIWNLKQYCQQKTIFSLLNRRKWVIIFFWLFNLTLCFLICSYKTKFSEGRLVNPSVMQRPLVLRPRHYPRTFKGLEWLTPKQRTFYHRYLRQAVMDVFNPPDGYGAGAFSLEQLKVAFKAVFGEAKAKCLKEAWNGTFNLPLKGNSNHLFFILFLEFNLIDNSWLSLFIFGN